MSLTVLQGDWIEQLRTLDDGIAQTCVTSPPYWGLRDYKCKGQIGLEKTPQEYVGKLVSGFHEVRRVLKKDGTLWLNLGDSYAAKQCTNLGAYFAGTDFKHGCKPKDLIGIPWMVAFALRNDGWYLRSDIIWAKPNPMPESVTDRPTRAHEYIFLLTKSAKYYYDYEAIKEASICPDPRMIDGFVPKSDNGKWSGQPQSASRRSDKQRGHSRRHAGFNDRWDQMTHDEQCSFGRNKRSVWTVTPANYPDSHFATFPPDLIKPCILAGSKASDIVLDPFGGSGTTAAVALELGRKAITIELNPDYIELINERTNITHGLPL